MLSNQIEELMAATQETLNLVLRGTEAKKTKRIPKNAAEVKHLMHMTLHKLEALQK